MKAAIISLGSISSKLTFEAMKKYFDEVDELNIKNIEINLTGKEAQVLYDGKPIEKYDCIFAKGSFRFAQILRSITAILEKEVYMPIKPSAFTIGHDKLLTHLKLQAHKVPMPKTYLSATIGAAKKILEKVNYPIVMKFPQGTQGKGVMFADSYSSASSVLDALSALRQPFLIQEFIETGSTDIRVIVVGKKVVAAMKRHGKENEKRANIHAGGVGEAYTPDSYTAKIAVEAVKAIGAEICGVDILETAKGPVVIEVNISPGLQGIMSTTKIDVANIIAKYLGENTKKRTDTEKTNGTTKIFDDLGIDQTKKQIISTLDFRGARILLPEIITKISGLGETDNVEITAKENYIEIKKFNVN
ncbi:MAG: RimK family alpha-L-glutamate ligase [Nanoarchaeota archaeon]|nr:RimK family alpha-L-glutamate ligase [Nanoarchaeota archaeon]MBU1030328.1 RimK family alpha-L-glutamate ligase [Nanoarchaeota archaeon]MBU1849093.1 RimK family alpha-L-glutamate ligase [Nanoarchaeota archaeon]